MKIRNAQYKNVENTIVDVEIYHPELGWIPYTFNSEEANESFDTEIREWLKLNVPNEYVVDLEALALQAEQEAKQAKDLALATLTVTTTQGNTFDGNSDARLNLTNAIMASDITGITETKWKLADNSVASVTVDELKEALALAIQEVGVIVGATE